jgi:phage tail tape-measure protein
MRVRHALLLAPILLATPDGAQAQEGAAAGAVTGAVAGALVGGPIGAVVGGLLGAAAGGSAQELARQPEGTRPVRPGFREPPVRVRTCVRDAAGRETCKTTVR